MLFSLSEFVANTHGLRFIFMQVKSHQVYKFH